MKLEVIGLVCSMFGITLTLIAAMFPTLFVSMGEFLLKLDILALVLLIIVVQQAIIIKKL